MTAELQVDVVVVGGGAAGLAAAVALGRSRRSVVVVDAGQPRNAPADGAHNVLGHEGIPPLELLARGRAEAEGYGVRIVAGSVTGASGTVDDFTIDVDGGAQSLRARRVVLATGLVDELPAVPGVEAAWGHSVLHCPFCHGWEVRDRRIAVLGRNENALHQVLLFRQLSDDVTLFLHEAPEPTEEQAEQLAAMGVAVVRPRVQRLVVDGTQVRAVEIAGGATFETDAVVVAPRFIARTEVYEALGGQPTTTPFGVQIAVDPRGATAVPGVWAAGNAAEPMAMVAASAASGVMAGAAVHGDLAVADLARASASWRRENGQIGAAEVLADAENGSIGLLGERVRAAVAEVQRSRMPAPAEASPRIQRPLRVTVVERDDLDARVTEQPTSYPGGGWNPRLQDDPQLDHRGRRDQPHGRRAELLRQPAAARFVGQDRDESGGVDDDCTHAGRPDSS